MGITQKLKKYSWLIRLVLQTPWANKKRLIEGYKGRRKYYKRENIDANLKEMMKCANCPNMCRFDCPALQVSKRETYSPANKTRIAYFMCMDRIPMDNPSAIQALYACMGCDACREWCSMDISAGDLLIETRHELEKRQLLPQFLQPLNNRISTTGSIFEQNPFIDNTNFQIDMINPQIFYFIGCMSVKYRPAMVNAHIAILKSLGIPFTTKLDQRHCCGSPLYEGGIKTMAMKLAQHNQKLIQESHAPIVISDCPGCVEMLRKTYPTLGFPLKGRILHSSEYFLELLETKKLVPTNPLSVKVTYHDPCVLARKLDNPDGMRKLFTKIPGLIHLEAYLHGKETQCCGYGSIYHVSNPHFSEEVRQKRLIELQKPHPDCIVSACPTCEYALAEAQKQNGDSPELIKDYVELLADSLGLKY